MNAFLSTFLAIAGVCLLLGIALAFFRLLTDAIIMAFSHPDEPEAKRKNDQAAEGESRKLKNDELPWIEAEKPKRTSHFELGDDGELFEVIDDQEDEQTSWK